MMKTLRLAALLLACMCAGAIGPSLQQAAYHTWDNSQEPKRFNTRVDEAMAANPFACGNGGCGLQGVQTAQSGTDLGAGLTTDATGQFVGLAAIQLEPYTWSGAQTFSGTAPQLICSNTTACEIDFGATSAPGVTLKTTGSLANGQVDFQFTGGSTNSTQLLELFGNGNIFEQAGDFSNLLGNIFDAAGSIVAQSVANSSGEIRSGNCANVTGAKGIGAMCAGGMFYSGTFCSVANGTTTNASPSLLTTLTTGQHKCKITSGSAAATVFNISAPGGITATNALDCQFTPSTAVPPSSVTSSTTLCILTYASPPGAVLLGQLDISGNGP